MSQRYRYQVPQTISIFSEAMSQSCRHLCRYRLILVQCRFMRSWLQSTITMLDITLALYSFTLETPWDDFTPMDVHQKIRIMSDYLEQILRQIGFLTNLTIIGCNHCRRTQIWILKTAVSSIKKPWISSYLTYLLLYLYLYLICLYNLQNNSPIMYVQTLNKSLYTLNFYPLKTTIIHKF